MLQGQSSKSRIEIKKKIHKFRGHEGLLKFIKGMDDTVLVHFDPDIDGEIAGILACKFLVKHGKKFQWYLNDNRAHGFGLPLDKVSGRDIIAVDFLITPTQIMELTDAGCNIVSIDHHVNVDYFVDIESDYGSRGIIVNNQYPFEEDDGRYLSGAGVVFELFCSIDPEFDTLDNRALVGLTLLSDVRDIENPYARYYLTDLYNHKMKGYIGYLIKNTLGEKDYGFGVPRMDRNYVDYTFSPAINACLRFNQGTMVTEFFLGSGEIDLGYHKLQKKLVEEISSKLKVRKFSNLTVCFFYETDITGGTSVIYYEDGKIVDKEILSSFVGLVASRMLDGYRSCICYMIAKDKNGKSFVKRASLRGNINGLDYISIINNLPEEIGKGIKGVGHRSACGIKYLKPNKVLFSRLNDEFNNLERNSNYKKKIIEVDNLSFFVSRNGKAIGEENMYMLSQNKTYVKYTGTNIQKKNGYTSAQEYIVDGISVMCFDSNVNFDNGLILPMQERGNLRLYLEEG